MQQLLDITGVRWLELQSSPTSFTTPHASAMQSESFHGMTRMPLRLHNASPAINDAVLPSSMAVTSQPGGSVTIAPAVRAPVAVEQLAMLSSPRLVSTKDDTAMVPSRVSAGLAPRLYADYLALVGKPEASVPGCGLSEKTAKKLVVKFDGVVGIVDAARRGELPVGLKWHSNNVSAAPATATATAGSRRPTSNTATSGSQRPASTSASRTHQPPVLSSDPRRVVAGPVGSDSRNNRGPAAGTVAGGAAAAAASAAAATAAAQTTAAAAAAEAAAEATLGQALVNLQVTRIRCDAATVPQGRVAQYLQQQQQQQDGSDQLSRLPQLDPCAVSLLLPETQRHLASSRPYTAALSRALHGLHVPHSTPHVTTEGLLVDLVLTSTPAGLCVTGLSAPPRPSTAETSSCRGTSTSRASLHETDGADGPTIPPSAQVQPSGQSAGAHPSSSRAAAQAGLQIRQSIVDGSVATTTAAGGTARLADESVLAGGGTVNAAGEIAELCGIAVLGPSDFEPLTLSQAAAAYQALQLPALPTSVVGTPAAMTSCTTMCPPKPTLGPSRTVDAPQHPSDHVDTAGSDYIDDPAADLTSAQQHDVLLAAHLRRLVGVRADPSVAPKKLQDAMTGVALLHLNTLRRSGWKPLRLVPFYEVPLPGSSSAAVSQYVEWLIQVV